MVPPASALPLGLGAILFHCICEPVSVVPVSFYKPCTRDIGAVQGVLVLRCCEQHIQLTVEWLSHHSPAFT